MRKTKRKSGLIKLRTRPPYRADGKTTMPGLWNRSGVYRIFENNKIVYIGYSATNIYRTMYRHFQAWNHKGQQVVTYADTMSKKKYTVQVTLCSPAKSEKLERALVIKYKPRDNENKYSQYALKLTDIELVNDFEEQLTEEAPF